MEVYSAVVGREIEIPLWYGTVTGLTFDTLETVQVIDGIEVLDIEDDLEGSLTEISGVPGYYLLALTPRRPGVLYLRLHAGEADNRFIIQSTLSVPPMVADPSVEGDHLVEVLVGGSPVPNATVRVYDFAGTTLVARGLTDSAGTIFFPLEVGQYQVRVSKVGFDFSDINPTTITVVPNNSVVPQLYELLPSSASIGDPVTMIGQFFAAEDLEVMFGEEVAPVLFVSTDLRVLMVEVPSGLTDLAIPIRVRKPDLDNPGDYLISGVLTMERIP